MGGWGGSHSLRGKCCSIVRWYSSRYPCISCGILWALCRCFTSPPSTMPGWCLPVLCVFRLLLQSCAVLRCLFVMLSDLVSKQLLSYASSHLTFAYGLFWRWGCFHVKKGFQCKVFTCSWLKWCCVSGWLSADQHPAGFRRRHSSVLLKPQLDRGGNQTRLQGCWNHPCHSAGRKHAGLRHHDTLPARHV